VLACWLDELSGILSRNSWGNGLADGEYLDAWWGLLIRVNADCAVYVNFYV